MSVTIELNVPARMRDGVILRANVYRPDGDGPWPTLLSRTPYGKDDPFIALMLDPLQAMHNGFMVVIQDTRGRFASDGDWCPFRHEASDGYDSVEWAARLPGSNGRVGMWGSSYVGNAQWMAAAEQPPSLAAIAPSVTWCDPLDGLFARGGALELGLAVPLTLRTGAADLGRRSTPESRLEALTDDYDTLASDGYWQLPVSDMPVLRRYDVPDLGTFRMLRDAEVPDWCRVRGRHDRVTVPTLHTTGWYDVFLQGALDNYATMVSLGRPARLVVGPWSHTVQADAVGQRYFGLRANRIGGRADGRGDINHLQLSWFSRHMRTDGSPDGDVPETPVRIFVMGRNQWRDESSWPLERSHVERWFLRSGGGLASSPPDDGEATTEFVYDPADPVPTTGGHTIITPALQPGPLDQARVEARDDVCVFTSEPLRADLEVTGRVRVVLHAESSAPSTDWVARLCDVYPDGRSFNLCDGILRVQAGAHARRRLEIDLWSTSNVFLEGHRLRVHVTSSSFPRWDRNLNTGDQESSHIELAHQRVHHGPEHRSWIELPVVA